MFHHQLQLSYIIMIFHVVRYPYCHNHYLLFFLFSCNLFLEDVVDVVVVYLPLSNFALIACELLCIHVSFTFFTCRIVY